MKLNPSEISNLIKSRIENFEALAEARTEGTVVTVTDGIIRVPANVEWCDTGINVRRGQRIAISAQGRWNYRSEPAFGPAGSGFAAGPRCVRRWHLTMMGLQADELSVCARSPTPAPHRAPRSCAPRT